MNENSHISNVGKLYDALAANGPYGTLAPDNQGGRKSRYVSEVFDAALLPIISAAAKPRDVLLDYGCGTGIFAVKAARLVDHVIGLDVSEAMLDWGRRLDAGPLEIDWILGNGTDIPLDSESVDWVVARESLCYVPIDVLPFVLEEICRVLRPGGRFLWLEQISDNSAFLSQPGAPLLEKRPADSLRQFASDAGLKFDIGYPVRLPRFPWIYAIWAGLVPKSVAHVLARLEVKFNRSFGNLRTNHWKDALLTFRKPQ